MLLQLVLLWLLPFLVFCADDYYKLLGVDKNAGDKELKKAYRALSKKFHPDKNPGNESARQKFVDIGEAYEALSNPETRKIYDQYGKDGLDQHKSGRGRSHDPFDLFSRFFGGDGHFGRGERRGPNIEAKVGVSLKDFYLGTETEFKIEKQIICDACEGTGSHDGEKHKCGDCNGHGVVVQKLMLAPGIFQQVQSQCGTCGGTGHVIAKPCKVCGGQKVVKNIETYQLSVEPGMAFGAPVVYENEAAQSPDWVPGDLIVQVMEVEPIIEENPDDRSDGSFFRRKGIDLFWTEVLSLREAWMGDWTRNVTHLDGHVVQLSRKRGEVVQPNTVEIVAGEGMPIHHDERKEDGPEFGALHVAYQVILPDQMEKGMEKDFWSLWDKWRKKNGIDLLKDSGRPEPKFAKDRKDEL